MHSYRPHATDDLWEVFFDGRGAGIPTLRTFASELDAAMYVNFLNGGRANEQDVARLFKHSRNRLEMPVPVEADVD